MTKTLTVAARELRERWLIFPASLALGFVPFALQGLGIARDDSTVVGLMTAVLLGAGASLVTGATIFARNASTSRLGFLLSQPVGLPSVWIGKWLAAVVTGGAAGLLAAVPWMLAYPSPQGRSWFASWDLQSAVFVVALLVIAIGLANLAATAFLSRSAWVVLDLAFIVVVVWGARRYLPFLLCGASAWRETLVLVLPALCLLAATAVQLNLGRTDLRRAHRALSLTFWACVLALLVSAAGHLHWVLAAGPAEMRHPAVGGFDASRRWVQLVGASARSRCVGCNLLLDLASGRHLPLRRLGVALDPGSWPPGQLSFAERAPVAARWVSGADRRSAAFEVFDLSGETPRLKRVPLENSAAPAGYTFSRLSPSGASALYVTRSTVSLFELQTGRAWAGLPVPPGFACRATAFVGERAARLWFKNEGGSAPSWRVLDLTEGASQWKDLALPAPVRPPRPGEDPFLPTADGARVVVFDGDSIRLVDGQTGTPVATLSERARSRAVGLLADGRLALATVRGDGRMWLTVFDGDGRRLSETDVAPGALTLGPIQGLAPGQIAVGLGPVGGSGDTLVVDVEAGRVVRRIEGLRLRAALRAPQADRSASVGLFAGANGALLWLDLTTGERRVVAGPGAANGERIDAR